MGWAKETIRAFALAAGLVAGASTCAANAAATPAHAPCTSLDLWGDLQSVINGCEALIKSGKLEGDDLAEALRHQGDAYFRSFNVRLASNDYRHALQLKPDWPEALWNLAKAESLLGNSDLGMKSVRRAIEVDPTFSPAHGTLANFLSLAGDNDGALKEYNRALELDPKNFVARYYRAIFYDSVGRKLDALHDFDTLLAEDETALSRTYLFGRRMQDEDFVGHALRARAIVLRNAGSIDEALATLQHALDRRPGYANAAVFQSELVRGSSGYESRYGDVLAAIDRAIAMHPDSPEVAVTSMERVNLLLAMGGEGEARKMLADSVRFESYGDGAFFMGRSEAWKRLKDFDRARADLIQAMSIDGESYWSTIERLEKTGYLMSWPGLDPQVAMANAITACAHDTLC